MSFFYIGLLPLAMPLAAYYLVVYRLVVFLSVLSQTILLGARVWARQGHEGEEV